MSAINNLIGQDHAKRTMSRAVWRIVNKPDEISDSFCFIGPPSSGKTVCARAMAKDAGVPLLELQPQAIPKASDLVNAIYDFELPSEMLRDFSNGGPPPRIAIFIDEVHQISNSLEQALLKALEPGDRELVAEDGRKVDTSRFVFMVCTTDRGDLFDALDTRTVKISLSLYSKAQVAQIVKLNFPKWQREACERVAHYCGNVPREALAFARDVQTEFEMTGNNNFVELCEIVATDHKIDSHGMTEARLAILTALGQAPISRSRIRHVCNVKDAELQKFILPPLLAKMPDAEMPLLTVSNKGYTITPAGLLELDKRDIPNRGDEAIPKTVRTQFRMDDCDDKPSESDTVRFGDFKRKA